MRPAVFVAAAALILSVVAAQNSLLQSTEAQTSTSAITACAVQGGSCEQPSLDSTPGAAVEHIVYLHGCSRSDLHVLRYVPPESIDGSPVVAAYCS